MRWGAKSVSPRMCARIVGPSGSSKSIAPAADASTTRIITILADDSRRLEGFTLQAKSFGQFRKIVERQLAGPRLVQYRQQLSLQRPVVPGRALPEAPGEVGGDVLHRQGHRLGHGFIMDPLWNRCNGSCRLLYCRVRVNRPTIVEPAQFSFGGFRDEIRLRSRRCTVCGYSRVRAT